MAELVILDTHLRAAYSMVKRHSGLTDAEALEQARSDLRLGVWTATLIDGVPVPCDAACDALVTR